MIERLKGIKQSIKWSELSENTDAVFKYASPPIFTVLITGILVHAVVSQEPEALVMATIVWGIWAGNHWLALREKKP